MNHTVIIPQHSGGGPCLTLAMNGLSYGYHTPTFRGGPCPHPYKDLKERYFSALSPPKNMGKHVKNPTLHRFPGSRNRT